MEKQQEEKNPFVVHLKREELIDPKGKPVKTPEGESRYKREDINGLMSLLGRFDSRMHDVSDMKMVLKIRDKLYDAWGKDAQEIELSLNEATFLKTYLQEFQEKDGKFQPNDEKKEPMREFEMRTLVGLLDEME
jgi:hypothetical protein